jgi:SAM-dependent methyltransferase
MGRMGGHCNMTNMDEGVLRYLVGTLSVKTMVDVGCGPGGMVELANQLGVYAYGIDGDAGVHPDFLHNFEDGPLLVDKVDLAWSVEFLEHIEEQYLDNVFSVFKQSRFVFCTANPKPGPWHFNCQPFVYWVYQFRLRGFEFNSKMTEEIKASSTMNREFVEDTGMFFFNIARCV